MSWIVNLIGLALMALIVWWFWIARGPGRRPLDDNDVIDIVVAGGAYHPAVIECRAGQILRLRFMRLDPNPRAEQVVFPRLDVSEALPLGEATLLTLRPERPGIYRFTCQMRLYKGTLIVHRR